MTTRVAELDMQMVFDRPEILCSVAWTVEITLVSIPRGQAVRRANSSLSNSSELDLKVSCGCGLGRVCKRR